MLHTIPLNDLITSIAKHVEEDWVLINEVTGEFTIAARLSSWLHFRLEVSDPGRKATMLLKYPWAFWYFQFYSWHIGYPKHVFARAGANLNIVRVVALLVVIISIAVGSIALWIALATAVWNSDAPSPTAAKMTVIACAALGILCWTAPQFTNRRRVFYHYGLSELLTGMDEEPRGRAHRRILAARQRIEQRNK